MSKQLDVSIVSKQLDLFPLVLTGSNITDYCRCPRLFYNKHILQRQPATPEVSDALDFGTLWHEHVADETLPVPPEGTLSGPEHTVLCEGLKAWRKWQAEFPGKILARELPLETPVGNNVVLRGKLDALVEWNGGYWHLQHKTLANSANATNYTRILARSWHEVVYRRLAIANGYAPWGGSILVTLRKLSMKAMAERGEQPLRIDIVAVPAPMENELEHVIDSIATRWHRQRYEWRQQPTACSYGSGYWRLCPYLESCNGTIPIESLPHVDPLARYATPQEDNQ